MAPVPTPPWPHGGDEPRDPVGPVLFVSDFAYLECAFYDLERVLLQPGGRWLSRIAHGDGAAVEDEEAAIGWTEEAADASLGADAPRPTVVRVGVGPAAARVPVFVHLWPPRSRTGEVVVRLKWQPVRLDRLLPALDGDLSVSEVEAGSCRVGLTGRYRPPLAKLGARLDRVALHRLAESSARNFLDDACRALLEEAAGGGPA